MWTNDLYSNEMSFRFYFIHIGLLPLCSSYNGLLSLYACLGDSFIRFELCQKTCRENLPPKKFV
jgi:hypothetical protein